MVGARVTVGHGALLEGCVVEDDSLIGMGAIVLQRAHVAERRDGRRRRGRVRAPADPGRRAGRGRPRAGQEGAVGLRPRWVEYAAQDYQVRRRLYLEKSEVVSDGLSEN